MTFGWDKKLANPPTFGWDKKLANPPTFGWDKKLSKSLSKSPICLPYTTKFKVKKLSDF